jgi:hypothetical protein
MIPDRLLPETLTWQQPGTTADRYGNESLDWTAPVSTAIRGRLSQVSARDVDGQTGPAATGQWKLLTNELGIGSSHRIVRGSDVFEVDGPPNIVFGAAGAHHLEAVLTWTTA